MYCIVLYCIVRPLINLRVNGSGGTCGEILIWTYWREPVQIPVNETEPGQMEQRSAGGNTTPRERK